MKYSFPTHILHRIDLIYNLMYICNYIVKVEIAEAKYDVNWNFLEVGGGGCKIKKPSMEGAWIFSGTVECISLQLL